MRKTITLIVACLFVCAFAQAQSSRTTSYVLSGKDATLDLDWTTSNFGTVQWQESFDDGATWTDINGATGTTYTFKADEKALYRAHIEGDPSCPEIDLEREVVPVTFDFDVTNPTATTADIEVTNLDIADAEIAEYGFAANLSALNRDFNTMPLVKVGEGTPTNGTLNLTCEGLRPNTTYSMRFYFKTTDGSVVISNNKIITTKAGIEWRSRNWTITTTTLRGYFELSGDATLSDINVAIGTTEDNMQDIEYTVEEDNLFLTELLENLTPGTTYFLRATALVDDTPQTATLEIKTYTDYSTYPIDDTIIPVTHRITWDEDRTLHTISDPSMNATEYPRVCRMANDDLLLTYHGGTPSNHWVDSYYRISHDNGETWTDQVKIFDNDTYFYGSGYNRIVNPQATLLDNGDVIMTVNANGSPDTNENSKVLCIISKDNGCTWSDPIIVGLGRTWEPHIVQLPGGELELVVSCEAEWWNGSSASDQEIVTSRSTNNGRSWTAWARASFRGDGGRDGMAVPVVLDGNRGIVFSVETPFASPGLPPSFVYRPLDGYYDTTPWNDVDSDLRWRTGLNDSAGGPYTLKLSTGEFVMTCQTNASGAVWQTSRPQVLLTDSSGHNPKYVTLPLRDGNPFVFGEGAYYNSLFQIDETHIWLLVTHVMYSGSVRGDSSIDYLIGTIEPAN